MWEGLQKQLRWNRIASGGNKGKTRWTVAQSSRTQHVPKENEFLQKRRAYPTKYSHMCSLQQ